MPQRTQFFAAAARLKYLQEKYVKAKFVYTYKNNRSLAEGLP